MGRIVEKIKVLNAYDIHDARNKRISESAEKILRR
jgi:hypothetical protein